MNKRGIAWLFMLELLAGVFSAFVIVNAAQLWASTDIFFETKVVRDVALITNSLYPIQGNIVSEYPTKLPQYIINFKNNQVEIFKQGDYFKPSSFFVTKQGNVITKIIENKNSLKFSKSADKIQFDASLNIKKLDCPVKQGPKQNIDSIQFLLDPGVGVSPVAGDLSESEINRLISLNIARKLTNKDSTRNLNVDEPRPIDWLSKITHSTDIVLSFHTGTYDDVGNVVKAYVTDNNHKQESVALVCNILNNLLDRYDDVSFGLVSKSQLVNMDEEMQILDNDKISVMLKIGNIRNLDTLTNHPEISDLIHNGLEEYYAR
jgi:hypothetical protein